MLKVNHLDVGFLELGLELLISLNLLLNLVIFLLFRILQAAQLAIETIVSSYQGFL